MQVMQKTSMGLARFGGVTLALWLGLIALPAQGEVAAETTVLGDYSITIYPQPFLSEEDLSILRFIASDQEYLSMFVPQAQGFSALAASPDEGFVKDGVPVPSAAALGGLPDAQTAAANAIAACQKAAASAAPCVVILQVGPK